ncbi:MAG: hypothetical protein WC523_07485 [Patescibacteria group bacterium]
MIQTIALISILGKPLFMYLGLLTFVLLLAAATVGRLNFKGNTTIPFKWHPRLVVLAMTVGIIHMILGLSVFFNF